MGASLRRLAAAGMLAATLALPACRGCQSPPGSTRQPKAVVLITIDTLRADSVSFAPDGPPTTPFLAKLASEGVIFDKAYATASWTAPSMASLFTGLEPKSHGVVRGVIAADAHAESPHAERQRVLAASLTTLAERFRDAGYRTVGVAANRHLAASLGFSQGFDAYLHEAPFIDADEVNGHVLELLRGEFGNEAATAWKSREKPTFLWMHYFDPHVPYEAREPWATEYGVAREGSAAGVSFPELKQRFDDRIESARDELGPLYRSEIRYVDDRLEALDHELGFSDPNVLVIVTSDHGEELGDHGGLGHGSTLFEETIRVPLFLRWPAGLPGGIRSDVPVTLLDVFPTVAALLSLEPPVAPQGIPLPLDDLARIPMDRPIFTETMRTRPRMNAVRVGDDKLIIKDFRHPRMRDRRRSLYDLGSDAREQHNLAATQQARAGELAIELMRHRSQLPAPPRDAKAAQEPAAADIERLRQLGYGD